MTTAEIAKAFTDMLKAGNHHGAAAKFNAPDIISIEAMEDPGARVQGTEALKAKWDWWESTHQINSVVTEGPYINSEQFAVIFDMDVTVKATGERSSSKEVALYTIKGGKIVEEKFMY